MDCSLLPEIPYSEFGTQIRQRIAADRVPVSGFLELTYRCNNDCVHCYCNLPANDRAAKESELSYEQLTHIIDQIVEEGCLFLVLTGGEPLLHPRFRDIYVYAKEKGLLITVFTNGTLITESVADLFADYYPFGVAITVYGATRETYERVTRNPGSYDRCMRGIELLLERGVTVNLRSIAMRLNKDEIPALKAFAQERELKFVFDPLLSPRKDGRDYDFSLRLTPEEIVALDLADEERVQALREFSAEHWGPPQPEYLFHCGAGVTSFSIDPRGHLGLCVMSSPAFATYDLLQGFFREGWREHIPKIRYQGRTRQTPCATCDLVSLCSWCPLWADLEMGDPEEPVEYLCEVAHLRTEMLDLGPGARAEITRQN